MATVYGVSTGDISLAVTSPGVGTPKTVIELTTSSTQGMTFTGMELTFAAVPPNSAVASCLVEWGTFASTGTGSALTPIRYGTGQLSTSSATVKVAPTSGTPTEPTSFAQAGLPSWIVPLPGAFSVLYPLNREFYMPPSTQRCLRLTVTVVYRVRADLYFEH